jgi:putative ABC transport system substrate-binding protein
MRRREFITLLGGAAAAWPLPARAQQPALPVVGFLNPESPDGFADRLRGFRQGLKDTGYVEGENVVIDYRWAEGQLERLPALAADLVRRQVSVIAAFAGDAAALAAKAATTTIPIVFLNGVDPIKTGLVASLNRPGGNVSGVSLLAGTVNAKRLELIHELVPQVALIAVLSNPDISEVEARFSDLQEAGRTLGLQLLFQALGARAIWTWPSQLWPPKMQVRFSSMGIRFSSAGAINSLGSRHATRYPRYTLSMNFLWSAV